MSILRWTWQHLHTDPTYTAVWKHVSNEKQWDYHSVISKSLLKDELKATSPTIRGKKCRHPSALLADGTTGIIQGNQFLKVKGLPSMNTGNQKSNFLFKNISSLIWGKKGEDRFMWEEWYMTYPNKMDRNALLHLLSFSTRVNKWGLGFIH